MTRKRKIIFSLLVIMILSGIYWKFFASSTKVAQPTLADTIEVQTGTIASSLQVLGTTKLVSSQLLTFGVGGQVTSVKVKQGDAVKKGQILAEIDSRNASNDIKQQQLSIQSAQISYDKLMTSTKQYQISQAENNVAQIGLQNTAAQLAIKNLEQERDDKIKQQQDTIVETKGRLALLLTQGTGVTLSDYSAWAADAGTTALDSIQKVADSLYTLKDMFHTDDIFASSRIYIGAKKGGINNADNAVKDGQNILQSFQDAYATFNATNPKTTDAILTLQNANKDMLIKFASVVQIASDAVNNSVVDSRYYPQSQINADSSSLSSMNSKAVSLLTSINNAIKNSQANTTDLVSLQNTIDTANRTIASLKASYALQIQQKNNDIAINAGSADVYAQTAQSLKDGPTIAERAGIQNQIAQAQVGLSKAQLKMEDYKIVSQFDGVVSAVDIKVGDQVTAMKEGITVEVPGIYAVDVLLDQLDVVKVGLGNIVRISFDAYPDEVITGTIDEIDPTPTTTQGVVSYTAKVILKKNDRKIYNQMTATVNVVLQEKTDVIVIPTLAITTMSGSKIVQIWNNGKIERRGVSVGVTNGKRTEIVTGLSVGERILTTQFKLNKVVGASSPFGGARGTGSASRGGAGGPPGSSAGGETRQLQNGASR